MVAHIELATSIKMIRYMKLSEFRFVAKKNGLLQRADMFGNFFFFKIVYNYD